MVLKRHTRSVGCLEFSKDGKRVASGSYDSTIRLWDAETGEEMHKLVQPGIVIHSMAFSPDGELVVFNTGGSLPVMETGAAGKVRARLRVEGTNRDVCCIVFSPDQKYIASGYDDGAVRIWDAETGEARHVLKGHTDAVPSIPFSLDARCLASGSADTTICIWDVETGEPVHHSPLKGHGYVVSPISFLPDGRHIVSTSADMIVCIWDIETGKPIRLPFTFTFDCGEVPDDLRSAPLCGAFSPDGNLLAIAREDGVIYVLDVNTGRALTKLLKPSEFGTWRDVISIAFSPDAKRIVSGSSDGTIYFWDIEESEAPHVTPPKARIRRMHVLPDGKHIVLVTDDGRAWIRDVETGEVDALKGFIHAEYWSSFSSDGMRVASPDGNKVRVWDAQIGEAVCILEGHTMEVRSVTFSSDRKQIASGSLDGTIRIWDAETGEPLSVLSGGGPLLGPVTFSPDRRHIASIGAYDQNKLIRLWDIAGGEATCVLLNGHTDEVSCIAFSSDGEYIVSGSQDRTIRIWNAITGEALRTPLRGHTRRIYSVAFSLDRKYIVSSSLDGTVRIWDAQTSFTQVVHGQLIGNGHDTALNVAFLPDGKHVISYTRDTARIWEISHFMDQETDGNTPITFSSNKAHALCYPDSLFKFGGVPHTTRNRMELVQLEDDGWVVGPEGRLLFWVHYTHHKGLLTPGNTRVIGPDTTEIDLSQFAYGHSWDLCYQP
jgi:WD40 repeat protein